MPRRRITYRQLETISTVARLNSFTKAAESLRPTQPAMSIQAGAIVETIGLPLFFGHSGRPVLLASASQELLATMGRLDDVWNRFESAMSEFKGLKRGKVVDRLRGNEDDLYVMSYPPEDMDAAVNHHKLHTEFRYALLPAPSDDCFGNSSCAAASVLGC